MRAYQPLLVCLDFTRRRWHNDESFKGAIWIVNDLYKEYKNSNVTIRIKDDVGNVLKEADYKVSKIARIVHLNSLISVIMFCLQLRRCSMLDSH